MRKPARREHKVEDYLVERVEALGGACEKHVNPGHRSDPDRLVSFPGRRIPFVCFVETKWAPDAQASKAQQRRHKWWRERGIHTFVIKSQEDVVAMLNELHDIGAFVR